MEKVEKENESKKIENSNNAQLSKEKNNEKNNKNNEKNKKNNKDEIETNDIKVEEKNIYNTGTSQDTQVFQFVRDKNYLNKENDKRMKAIEKENANICIEKNNGDSLKKVEKTEEQKKIKNSNEEVNKKNNSTPNYNNYQEKNIIKNYNNYEEKNIKNKQSSKKRNLVILLIITLIILIIVIFSTIFSLINMNSEKIIKGVYINNIDVSNLTKSEAIEKLEYELNNNEKNYIVVKHNEYSKEIYLQDIGGRFNVIDAVDIAYNLGRNKDIIQNNYKTLGTMISGANITIGFTYDEELLKDMIDKVSLEIPDLAIESSYIIDGNNLIIKNSKDGVQIQEDSFVQNLINAFSGNEKEFEIQVEQCQRKEIDIEKIHEEIYKKPVNAYYTTNPYNIYKEENGLDFAISLNDAKKMLLEDKNEYIIQLKTLKPQITVSDLDSGAYPDLLSTFTTKYGTGDANRNTNIALAAKSINSVVLMPGETFSYNDLIGECSTRTGYKAATIYLNGELSTGIGGGICQVSTTLYNTVLRANLEIVERRNHSLGVTYVPAGQDAMVSIGTQDFKFKNNRNYPIKVVAFVGTGSVTCQIYGLKQDTEYEVKLYSRTISKTDTKYKVETYKILYLNGTEVSRTWLSTDTYKYH